MDLMHRKNIEKYSVYPNINKRGTLDGTSFINIEINGIFFYTLPVHQIHQMDL